MQKKVYLQYGSILLFIVVAYLAYLVVQPFIIMAVSALVLGYLFYPVYNWLNKYIPRRGIASFLTCVFIVAILGLIILTLFTAVAAEARPGFERIAMFFADDAVLCVENSESSICQWFERIVEWNDKYELNRLIRDWFLALGRNLGSYATDFILSLPGKVVNFFIVMFITFYVFIDGKDLLKLARKVLPMTKQHFNRFEKTLANMMHAVVYGQILTAIIQGVVAIIGYYLIGDISNPILWGVITAIFALLPVVGTGFVWVPMSLYMAFAGIMDSDSTMVFRAIGLFLYGLLVISTIDNFVRPKIIGDSSGMHPALVLIGVFGGIIMFGLVGLVLGPLVIAFFLAYLNIMMDGVRR